MSLNLGRGLWRLSLAASAALFVLATVVAADHFARRRAAWKTATSQPPGPPVVLLSGTGGGFVTFPAGTDPAQTLPSVLALEKLPDETQVMEWAPGCGSGQGKVFNLDALLKRHPGGTEQSDASARSRSSQEQERSEPVYLDDAGNPIPPMSRSKAQPTPKPYSTAADPYKDVQWEPVCPCRPFVDVNPIAGYLEDGGRLYSRLEVLVAERESTLSMNAIRILERARSSGAFPRPVSETSWREVWQAIGLCLSLGAAPLALFAIVRWILRGFAGG